jgi:hypothetical protein
VSALVAIVKISEIVPAKLETSVTVVSEFAVVVVSPTPSCAGHIAGVVTYTILLVEVPGAVSPMTRYSYWVLGGKFSSVEASMKLSTKLLIAGKIMLSSRSKES